MPKANIKKFADYTQSLCRVKSTYWTRSSSTRRAMGECNVRGLSYTFPFYLLMIDNTQSVFLKAFILISIAFTHVNTSPWSKYYAELIIHGWLDVSIPDEYDTISKYKFPCLLFSTLVTFSSCIKPFY
jgi:hypothetical protein